MDTKKNILLVAHYFSPLNSTGARRPEALVKYLLDKNYNVTVLTTLKSKTTDSKIDHLDKLKIIQSSIRQTTLSNVIPLQDNISDAPDSILRRFKKNIINKFIGQIIDPRFLFILNILYKYFTYRISNGYFYKWMSYITKSDYIISTSPPWICHLLSIILSKFLKIPIVLDYRDQFSKNHMFSQNFSLIETKIDAALCNSANLISVVSSPMKIYYENISATKVITVMNGFEPTHFQKPLDDENHYGSVRLTIRYFGTITNDRLMPELWDALKMFKFQDVINLEFYGDNLLLKKYLSVEFPEIISHVQFFGSVKHTFAIDLMLSSDVLLFTETSDNELSSQQGVLTTKLFEYLAAKKPILGIINRKTAAGQIIIESGLEFVVSNESKIIFEYLTQSNLMRLQSIQPNTDFINNFSRFNQFSILENALATL